jgi:hypothetical protein
MDHIWPLFRYCATSDDDEGVLREAEAALARAREQVELRFPRAVGPWSGFGCERTLERSASRVAAMSKLGSAVNRFVFANELLRAWHVLSPSARARVAAIAPLSDRLVASLHDADPSAVAPFLEHGLDESLSPTEIGAWLDAARALVASGALLRSLSQDRYVSSEEHVSDAPDAGLHRRTVIEPPDARTWEAALTIIASLRPETPREEWARRKERDEPFAWIEAACFEPEDR